MIARFLLLLNLAQVQSGYSVTEYDSNEKTCELAVPIITNFSPEGRPEFPIVDVLNSVNVSESELLRVGYVSFNGVFDFVGCIDGNKSAYKRTFKLSLDKLGLCYAACKTTHIGIFEDTCYCLDDFPEDSGTLNCKYLCREPGNRHCKELGEYMSIFKYAAPAESGITDGNLCRLFNPVNMTYSWRLCQDFYMGLCTNDKTSTLVKQSYHWWKYLDECLSQNMFPATESTMAFPGESHMWLGQIRSNVVTKDIEMCEEPLACVPGYIFREGTTFYLTFQTSNYRSKALCDKDKHTVLASTAVDVVPVIIICLTAVAAIAAIAVIAYFIWFRCQRRRNHEQRMNDTELSERNTRDSAQVNEQATGLLP